MRWLLTPLLILATGTVRADDTPKPNALSPAEIAEGWLLLFDGESTFGWKSDGDAKADGGALMVGGDKESSIRTTAEFGNFLLRFEYRYEGTDRFRVLMFDQNPYMVGRNPSDWKGLEYRVETNDQTTTIDHQIIQNIPARVRALVNPTRAILKRRGKTSLGFSIDAGGKLFLRNIKLKPLGLDPIFNGKDLSGWKQYAGDANRSKSKFAVTQEGWLNVENGPGDLQTERQWQDFVFQGECISHGKHLNSGVFFRCLQGQYQNGYEMQIRNQWEGDDRTKPVDFGTGAIYRRQPARKVVSTDGEWFTMTLVAHGNHFATWVDGYQVTDWTDTRSENANARNGCKLGAGPLSIQGHDPTTDLSFRNLRVAELPKKKD
jgi:hypothetical protein